MTINKYDNLAGAHRSSKIIEPRHDKSQQNDCAPSEDSDQPGPPSLISLRCALSG